MGYFTYENLLWAGHRTLTPAPLPQGPVGKTRDMLVREDELCSFFAGLLVTQHHPYSPLELPSPILLPNECISAYSTPAPYSSYNYPRCSHPQHLPTKQSTIEAERSDSLFVNPSSRESIPRLRNTLRSNRRRPRPRPHRHLVYQRLDEAESNDPPPTYSAIDPLQSKCRLHTRASKRWTWRDGLRLHRRRRSSGSWTAEDVHIEHRGRQTARSERTGVRKSVKKVGRAVSGDMDRALRKFRDLPHTAL
jgi:hypothetical protein